MFEPLCAALDAAGIACTRKRAVGRPLYVPYRWSGRHIYKTMRRNPAVQGGGFLQGRQGARYYLLGNGSNILFEDAGFRGAVLDLTAMKTGIGMKENIPGEESGVVYCNVTVGAGMKLSTLCNFALNHSCTGLEFAYGIPGTVGGAIYMNAGAYGGEMKDVLTSVEYLAADGNIVEVPAAELDLSYRHSIFEENGGCILSATFRLKKGDAASIKARMDELMQKRIDKQPLDKPSAGSTFKRPAGAFRRGPHRPVRPAGLPPRRGCRQRKALRFCGQLGWRNLCRCTGTL